jgi:hypothetical protein
MTVRCLPGDGGSVVTVQGLRSSSAGAAWVVRAVDSWGLGKHAAPTELGFFDLETVFPTARSN